MVIETFKKLFGSRQNQNEADALYRSLVAAARQPVFYTRLGVEDTLDGRFDMILLHLFVAVDRLALDGGPQAMTLARDLQEMMIRDMDRSLREMGVGDMSVGKKIKAMGEAWFGRRTAYQAALASDEPGQALAAAIDRNIVGPQDDSGAGADGQTAHADQLARYTLALREKLSDFSSGESAHEFARACEQAVEEISR